MSEQLFKDAAAAYQDLKSDPRFHAIRKLQAYYIELAARAFLSASTDTDRTNYSERVSYLSGVYQGHKGNSEKLFQEIELYIEGMKKLDTKPKEDRHARAKPSRSKYTYSKGSSY